MAEPLKNQFGVAIPARIADAILQVYPTFPAQGFIAEALDGYEPLDLMARGRKIAGAMRSHLPLNFPDAVAILVASFDFRPASGEGGMASFFFLPHAFFVSEYGLEHFEASMQAQYELTQRFTAEFSIRPFLERYPEQTLARLREWAGDSSEHVRRLVSEGSRPRLPWAPRLRAFQRDPAPVLALLELLKDDPALYVRRSVANSLNDIGKDHPELLVETARRWMVDATEERRWIVRHALRFAIKRADPGALEVMGFGQAATVVLRESSIVPPRASFGSAVTIAFDILNTGTLRQRVLIDFRVSFMKANGKTSPKVFKLRIIDLAPGEPVRISKKLRLADLSTRKHYPGQHAVEVLLNGLAVPLGKFELMASGDCIHPQDSYT